MNYWLLECALHTTFHSGDGRFTKCYGSLAPIQVTCACHCCYDVLTRNLDGATSPATLYALFDHSVPRTHGAGPHSALRISPHMPSLYTWRGAAPLRATEAQSRTTTCLSPCFPGQLSADLHDLVVDRAPVWCFTLYCKRPRSTLSPRAGTSPSPLRKLPYFAPTAAVPHVHYAYLHEQLNTFTQVKDNIHSDVEFYRRGWTWSTTATRLKRGAYQGSCRVQEPPRGKS
jgi:hypothetical protein